MRDRFAPRLQAVRTTVDKSLSFSLKRNGFLTAPNPQHSSPVVVVVVVVVGDDLTQSRVREL